MAGIEDHFSLFSDLKYRPLCYFWIAEFSDGSALPQFDPETGKENEADPDWLPSEPDQPQIRKDPLFANKKLLRFGWYPFTPELAEKILEKEGLVVIPTNNPLHVIELEDGERPIAYRTNAVSLSLRGGVSRGKTAYVLGKAHGEVLHICEDGSIG